MIQPIQRYTHFHAVIMGFNKYTDNSKLPDLKFAEKDARDLKDVLTDKKYCNYSDKEICLIVRNDPDKSIEATLYQEIVQKPTKNDMVLVYYSGHGFLIGDQQEAYLALPNVTIDQIYDNPRDGLSMKWFYNEIFSQSPAKEVVFILDCCHSGSFFTNSKSTNLKSEVSDYKDLIKRDINPSDGKIVLVSSPHGVSSRENDTYKNGIFTHFLLEGLRGEAAPKPFGDITVLGLMDYIQNKMPPEQPALHYGQGAKIVISHYHPLVISPKNEDDNFCQTELKISDQKKVTLNILSNPLDSHTQIIDELLDSLKNNMSDLYVSQSILNSIRQFLDADFVSLEKVTDIHSQPIFRSNDPNNKNDTERIRNKIIELFSSELLLSKEQLLESRFGFYKSTTIQNRNKRSNICIPLVFDDPKFFLLVAGTSIDKLDHGQILARLLVALFETTQKFTSYSQTTVENALLDDLKKWFGYLPLELYLRRQKSFSKKLNTIEFYFQPIVNVSKAKPYIHSWEALARDPSTNTDPTIWKSPADLFTTAELWGRVFIEELDIYCLNNAVATYAKLQKKISHTGSKMDSLSVNVYPDSLYSPVYKKAVQNIIEKQLIRNDELTLEISERRALPKPTSTYNQYKVMDGFQTILADFNKDLNISFSLDDFGVGYSSVDRLAKLNLSHIKIDKDVLHHPFPSITLNYVQEMIKKLKTTSTTIVVEGYDESPNIHITLKELMAVNITYIQGHIIRRASNHVRNLSDKELRVINHEKNRISEQEDE